MPGSLIHPETLLPRLVTSITGSVALVFMDSIPVLAFRFFFLLLKLFLVGKNVVPFHKIAVKSGENFTVNI